MNSVDWTCRLKEYSFKEMSIIDDYRNSLIRADESFALDFHSEGMPIHVSCRILERGISLRKSREDYEHPSPPFSRLFLFRKGGAEINMAHSIELLREGRIYLIPAGHPFTATYEPGELIYFHILVSDITGESALTSVDKLTVIDNPEIFSALTQAAEQNDPLEILSNVTRVIALVLKGRQADLVASVKRTLKLSRFFTWVKLQPPAITTLADAAELYQITPSAFSKRFSQIMGISFKTYMTNLQLQQAERDLLLTDKSIREIAEDLGHAYPQYFHRFFKKHFGCTPQDYRKHNYNPYHYGLSDK